MAVDTVNPRTRRALLTAGLGAIVASVASAVGRPAATRAADGDPVKLGQDNTATLKTTVTMSSADTEALEAVSPSGTAVRGTSASGIGVVGTSASGFGVGASSQTSFAILALSGGTGPAVAGLSLSSLKGPAGRGGVANIGAREMARRFRAEVSPAGTLVRSGILGEADQDVTAVGVMGVSDIGTGLRGQTSTGFALSAQGRVKFSTSGVATIQKGDVSVTVAPGVDVTFGSFVLLTPRANIGTRALWFTTNPAGNRFTIRVSSALPANLKVSWLMLG